ncbi:WSC-domain-containing protein [Lentinus tigrinus ALCF2SS1-7]|uniref:WSC-domain-containing protein n=1 Tax=Lentinus tigrinus ALCF2SS1-6 TaxID=1328759 RepID=A0A5C2SB75_9APHY|nr:WSC-domain-containing protein [Lentinus tigrinus ALCF2SS1-6]RPD70911.1 WSC-domain-containing protein [Lentinus tigrinus ALCF2SS1-7]
MFSKLLSLAALAAVANAEHWIFGGSRPIATTRLDSIVSPGGIGTHVHSIVGASRFKNTYDADDLMQSKCTTIPVQPDKSNYWAPQMYHRDQNTGVLTPMQTGFNIYYLVRDGPKGQPIKAFPKGLRMVAGDTNRKTYNASSFADQAVSYVCLDYSGAHNNDPDWAERPNFFDHNCPNGMRAQVFFPSCWDGVNLDSADHKSHMAYPIQNYNSGDCPDSHPVHLVSLFYEMFVSVDQYSYWGPGTWVLANGDTTGYGHHGDFQNGWDIDLLQTAIDTCTAAAGNVMDCPALAAVFDQASADACVLETELVDENIGDNTAEPITQLPGCNPIWDGTGSKPACSNPNAGTPELVAAQVPLPSGWSEIGCIAEGTSGRALTGASTTSPNMTRAVCANFCASKGFKLAGIEFSDECYCDNQVRNGASQSTITWNLCTNHCAGNENEICGGPARLTLLTASGAVASSSASVHSTTAKPSSTANTVSSVVPVSSSSIALARSSSSVVLHSSSSVVLHSSSAVATTTAHSSSVTSSKTGTTTSAPAASSSSVVVPAGWVSAGCVSDNAARALTGYSFANDQMTVASCVSTCASKGYSMAGVEYGRECYCGDALSNGQGKTLTASTCNMACAGDKTATCGDNWALNAFKTTNVAISLPSNSTAGLPSGWTALGCRKDNVSGRTLNVDAFTSNNMTIATCVAHCAALGHPMAGLEYARECYCGSAFVNGGGATLAQDKCSMACSGDSTAVCGGPDALTVFSKGVSGSARRAHKARNFGRAHQHADMF